jgi:MFS family permease
MTAAESPVRSPRLALLGVFGSGLLCLTALGAALPVLPRYVAGPVGGGDVAVGVVIGAFAAGAIGARPLAGRLADARGRRAVLCAGALVMALSGVLLFVPAGIPGLVVARVVLGVGEALVFTAGATWVVDLAPTGRRAQSIGLFGLAVWTGLSVGTLAGELVFDFAGFAAVWALTAALPLAGAALVRRMPDPHCAPPPGYVRAPLLPRPSLAPGLALGLASVGYATMASFVVLRLDAAGVGGGALVFTTFTAAVVAARLLGGRLPDRIGARPCAVAAGVAEGVGLALVAAAGSLPVAIAGALVLGIGFSLLYPALALLVVERVEESRRGAALGAFTAFFDLGLGLGAPLAGAIASLGGYPASFVAAAGLSAIGALFVLGGAPLRRRDFGTVAARPTMPSRPLSRARDPRP